MNLNVDEKMYKKKYLKYKMKYLLLQRGSGLTIGQKSNSFLQQVFDSTKITKDDRNNLCKIDDDEYEIEGCNNRFKDKNFEIFKGSTREKAFNKERKELLNDYLTLKYKDGKIFIGKLKNGNPLEGIMTYTNGNKFEGKFTDGKRGKPLKGIMTYINGEKFDGKLKDGKPLEGIMTYTNGEKFDGLFIDDKPSKGIMTYTNGEKFDGELKDGKPLEGIMTYTNGNKVEGEFENGNIKNQDRTIKNKKNDFLYLYFDRWKKSDPNMISKSFIKEFKDMGNNLQTNIANDKDFFLQAINQHGLALALEVASDELKKDKELVLVAIKQDGLALEFASNKLKEDKDFIFSVVKQNRLALKFASDKLKEDKDFIFSVVKQDGLALKFASDELKKNYDIILAAVIQNGRALEYASNELKKNYDIILAAVKQNGQALNYADLTLLIDEQKLTVQSTALKNIPIWRL